MITTAALVITLLPYITSGAGQTFDAWSTKAALNRGCVEGNSYGYGSSQPSTTRLVAVKSTTIAGTWAVVWGLQRTNHPKVAAFVGHYSGGMGAAFGVHNTLLKCGGDKQ